MSFLDDFMVRAALAGIGVALAAGPLGCFVVWRRMAYFGDATAHASVLGVALALGLSVSVGAGAFAAAAAMALAVSSLSGRTMATDTLLGVASHAALAVGLVALALAPARAVDLEALLFGDVLAVTRGDLLGIWIGAGAALVLALWRWPALVTTTLSPELAAAEGLSARREQLALTLALAILVAAALKVVGALLVTALLVIPAAAARALARTPEGMALGAAGIGALAVLAGLRFAWVADAPAGPSMAAAAALGFALAMLLGAALRRRA